jgi:acetyl esterase/lipase
MGLTGGMPQRARDNTQKPVPVPLVSIADIEYGQVDGISLQLDLLAPYPLPTETAPVLVRATGAGWAIPGRAGASMGSRPPGVRHLAAAGYVVAVVSTRLSWQARFPAQIHDLKAAIRWLRAHAAEYPIDISRIGIVGDSAGGHLAALAGLTDGTAELEGTSGSPGHSSAVQAVAAISAPTDFLAPGAHRVDEGPSTVAELFGGTLEQRYDLMSLASPLTHVHAGAPPFLIVHGTRDETVPFAQGKRLHGELLAAGNTSEFVPIEGGYHNLREVPDIPYASPVWDYVGDLVLSFFDRHLRPELSR